MYDKKHKELKEKQYDLGIQLEEFTKADESYHITARQVLSLAQRASDILESSEVLEKQEFLRFLLQNPTAKGKKLVFTMREPFEAIAKCDGHLNLLRLLDAFRTVDWRQIEQGLQFSGILGWNSQLLYRI